ncbi:MAG: hypothetical protein RLZZ26_197 [Candidatus Parcubacteria bacterium]|jgi:cellulose synthase/poly-beta-1,6-N-acetylglucosamine synthase-like glycosyltransferase/glycosyltransferase involved in cell wall biosynthesis/O-antigen/teichoic acid export membrane protein
MTKPSLSIVIPAYNEAARIERTLESIENYFVAHNDIPVEVIVVDDGSADTTARLVETYPSRIKNVQVLVNEKNRGKGYSVKRGMLAATGDYRLFMDADNSVDISHIDEFMRAMQDNVDVAIGSIKVGSSHAIEHAGWYRRYLGSGANTLVQLLAVPGIHDTQRGFKLFSAKAADTIFPRQTIERFGFDIEVLVIARKHGLTIKELPVMWDNPAGSKVTFGSYFKTLGELSRITTNRLLGAYSPRRVRATHYKADPDMTPIMSGERQVGFDYKGNTFVHHANLHITESAFFNFLTHQKIYLGVIAGFLAFAFYLNWQVTAIVIFALLTVLYFFDLLFGAFIVFRSYKSLPEISIGWQELALLPDAECPSYTIFCPLYKEWQVVPQFVEAMQKLDYPHEKLQILFLLEENDVETIERISASSLPPHFQIVVVPHSKPKTKPKAMNYGLNYATGEYIVIYDAEDVPESDQLKKAVIAFKKVDQNVACIQAKLNFYNPRQNILTRLFTAEYSLWFDLILPGFQSIAAPIPLGGTSNHFRASTLHKLGGWDAFNVTEDCDLGMRLAKRGYKTAIVDSTTHEEANSDLLNWYNQRSRWIKGYIQTYFVHMRNPGTYFADGNWRDFFLFQLIVGGKILSLFINPLMWVITICYFMFRAHIGLLIESFFPGPILYIGVFSLVFGNFLYLYYYMVGCVKRGQDGLIKYIFLVPLYWLGMSFAAWKALYEIVVKPHYWAKTVHGLHLSPAAKTEFKSTGTFDVQALMKKQIPQIAIPLALNQAPVAPVVAAVKAPVVRPVQKVKLIPTMPIVTPRTAATLDAEPELVRILNEEISPRKEAWPTRVRAFAFSGAGLLVISSVLGNFINFAFNAYLGRTLSFTDFGTITIVNTFVYILSLFTGALSNTTIHEVSFFEGVRGGLGTLFYKKNRLYVLLWGLVACLLWLFFLPDVGAYFNIANPVVVVAFTPAIVLAMLSSLNKGYLQGTFNFGFTALSDLLEISAKFVLSIVLVRVGLSTLASLAIPSSMAIAWVASGILAYSVYRKTSPIKTSAASAKKFPIGFYAAALMSGVSVAAFLTIDVILAKHYLSPDDAGRYALLSLIGKMVFFFGSLLNTFIMPVVSRAAGENRDGDREFAKIFAGTAFLTIGSVLGLAIGGFYFVPLLLGIRAISIVPFVPLYAIGMGLFTLSSTIVYYQLARKRYLFPLVSFAISASLLSDIIADHASIQDFVTTIATVNAFAFAVIVVMHLFYEKILFAYRNIVDALRVFDRLPHPMRVSAGKMKILVYNWRDSESVFAGGAETYIHALAERWAADGHAVTLFTSNDGTQKPNGLIHGVRVIRRGGFFGVYALAPLYYFFKFRGEFDVIIDCENGIPFFTPLYAKEPVYCLLHHIHQDVFRKSLMWPFSALAQSLEKNLMPLVYRNCSFITVSESSKRDMLALNITRRNIEVVHPGVDLSFLRPGQKSSAPQVAYVGRLKGYKSIDVLIRAFAQVLTEVPEARLVIAGGGDDGERLKQIAQDLKLEKQVTFLGKVTEEDKLRILQESWVCVNPSLMEGWGITVIEANACGTPVIASDVPGLRDSVYDRETGILVPHGNVNLLAAHITHMLRDDSLRAILSRYAIQWAQNFAWQKSSEKFLAAVSKTALETVPGIPAVQRI